jgi:peptidoglycan/xylan/chitin deacetylase (PgdA/CDA1 family)
VDAVARAAGVTLPGDLMMTRAQVRGLHRAGMGIGAHTRRHPILARESADTARDEIAGGKAELEAILDAPVNLFAYPNGKPAQDYRREHVEQVRDAGFHAAVSTAWGASKRGADAFQLARFTPWDVAPARFVARLLLSRRDDPAGLV